VQTADTVAVSERQDPLGYLNSVERASFGWLACRLYATSNPRFQRALQKSGPEATARLTCVNALRLYAVVLFVLGSVCRLAGAVPLAYLLYGVAGACMAWSFWCLYTVVRPEREFRRHRSPGAGAA
jgi:hypothetical protein